MSVAHAACSAFFIFSSLYSRVFELLIFIWSVRFLRSIFIDLQKHGICNLKLTQFSIKLIVTTVASVKGKKIEIFNEKSMAYVIRLHALATLFFSLNKRICKLSSRKFYRVFRMIPLRIISTKLLFYWFSCE